MEDLVILLGQADRLPWISLGDVAALYRDGSKGRDVDAASVHC